VTEGECQIVPKWELGCNVVALQNGARAECWNCVAAIVSCSGGAFGEELTHTL
jgi:hypothetical protein